MCELSGGAYVFLSFAISAGLWLLLYLALRGEQ